MIFFTALTAIAAFVGIWMSDRALDASIQASRTDQRAWLGLADFAGQPDLDPGALVTIRGRLLNTGKTPALKAVVRYGLNFIDKDQAPDQAGWLADPKMVSVSVGAFQPNSSYALLARTPAITQSDSASLKQGSVVLYAFGLVEYSDIFGATHRAKYCYFLKILAGAPDGFSRCPGADLNDAD